MSKRLDRITVPTPCTVDWNTMQGDDKVRFCSQCKLNVHNLSAMSQTEAENLMDASEGRLCVRFYRRLDGTVVTDNCPVGLRAMRDKARLMMLKTAANIALLSGATALAAVALNAANPSSCLAQGAMAPSFNRAVHKHSPAIIVTALMSIKTLLFVSAQHPHFAKIWLPLSTVPPFFIGCLVGAIAVDEGGIPGLSLQLDSPEMIPTGLVFAAACFLGSLASIWWLRVHKEEALSLKPQAE